MGVGGLLRPGRKPALAWLAGRRPLFGVEDPDGVFAVVAANGAEFGEDGAFFLASGFAVSDPDLGKVFFSRVFPHIPRSFRLHET